MSISLFNMGAVVPLDPRTGEVIGKPWCADSNTATPTRTYEAARFPIQSGYGVVTDAILRNPPELSVVFTLSDVAPTGHFTAPQSKRGRAFALARAFETIEQRLGPCKVWVRGWPPLINYGITSVTPAEIAGMHALTLSVSFHRLTYTTLYNVPTAVSPELLALGILPV